jgi:site-specific DNA recombinase
MQTQLDNLKFTVAPAKRVAIYLRVSTEEQASENRNGLKMQEDSLRQYCTYKNYTVSDNLIFVDAGLSGSLPIEKRPALKDAIERGKAGEFDILLIYKIDRLFRALSELLIAQKMLKIAGVELESPNDQIDTSTPMGLFGFQLIGGIAELERGVISMRMMGGKTRAAKEGKWVTGVPPYGYRINKETKKLIIEEKEADTVRIFFEWLVEEKCSLREITRRAIQLNLPTPEHKPRKGQSRIGGIWYKRTINRILVNETYTGDHYHNKYKRPFKYLDAIENTEHQRPETEHILVPVPPIISRDMFVKAIKQLGENRSFQKRNEKRTYLFSGLLYSGDTGRKLQSGYQKPKKDLTTPTLGKYYHVYTNALDRHMAESPKSNPEGQCAETRLLPIWDTLLEILSDPSNVLPRLEEYTFKNRNDEKTKRQIGAISEQLDTLKAKHGRIVQAYTGMNITDEQFQHYISENKANVNSLTIERDKLRQSLMQSDELVNRNEIIAKLFKQFSVRLKAVTYEEQQYIMRLFIEKINLHIKNNYAEVIFRFPVIQITSGIAKPEDAKNMRLVLHVKILSEAERRRDIHKITRK